MADESKQDLFLKRAQILIAILAGVTTLAVGVYNIKKSYFSGGRGEIRFTVVSDAGGQVSGARVQMSTTDGALIHTGTTDGAGNYSREDLEADSYILKVLRSGFEPEAVTVRVNPKRTSEIEMSLRPSHAGAPATAATPARGGKIQSVLEDSAASWIQETLGKKKQETTQ